MMTIDAAIRDRLALSLDTPSLDIAEAMADRLAPWFGIVKIGYELAYAEGPVAVEVFRKAGYRVFVDAKLHDIPNTVASGARSIGRIGAAFVTIHTSGGEEMVRAGVDGLRDGAASAGLPEPVALGVTVLTSDRTADAATVEARMAVARDAGCGGMICAAAEISMAARVAPGLLTVVPGIRLPGSDANDQGRPATPGDAIGAGASILVIGRTVTAAADPEAAAQRVHDAAAEGRA